MAETAVSLRLEDWSQLLVKFQNAVGLEKADAFIKEADIALFPKEHPNMIVLRWIDYDIEMPETEAQDKFKVLLQSYKYNSISIPDYVDGMTEHYDYALDSGNFGFDWQWPVTILPNQELYIKEHERILPKVIKLAMDAGVTEEQLLSIFKDGITYRLNEKEVFDAYIEKSKH